MAPEWLDDLETCPVCGAPVIREDGQACADCQLAAEEAESFPWHEELRLALTAAD